MSFIRCLMLYSCACVVLYQVVEVKDKLGLKSGTFNGVIHLRIFCFSEPIELTYLGRYGIELFVYHCSAASTLISTLYSLYMDIKNKKQKKLYTKSPSKSNILKMYYTPLRCFKRITVLAIFEDPGFRFTVVSKGKKSVTH